MIRFLLIDEDGGEISLLCRSLHVGSSSVDLGLVPPPLYIYGQDTVFILYQVPLLYQACIFFLSLRVVNVSSVNCAEKRTPTAIRVTQQTCPIVCTRSNTSLESLQHSCSSMIRRKSGDAQLCTRVAVLCNRDDLRQDI